MIKSIRIGVTLLVGPYIHCALTHCADGCTAHAFKYVAPITIDGMLINDAIAYSIAPRSVQVEKRFRIFRN